MIRLWFLLILGGLVAPAIAQPPPARIAVVSIHIASTPAVARAGAARLAGRVAVDFYGLDDGALPGIAGADLEGYDLVLLDAAGPAWLGHLDRIEALKRVTRVAVVGAGTPIAGNVDPARHPDIARYWQNASEANYAGLFAYLAGTVLGRDLPVPSPEISPNLAAWHPDAPAPFTALADYLGWAATRLPDAGERPRIGILFYRSLVLAENAAVIEALVREVEAQGGLPVPVWREGGGDLASAWLGDWRLDALILCGNRIDYGSVERGAAEAARLGVPPLGCAIDTARSPDQWRAHPGGFAPGQTGLLALGEMEGIVEPMAVGARGVGQGGDIVDLPMPEQVRWRVARAMAWARLHRLPNAEKRIAVTYHSEDASEADLGSDPDSYLDAQASIVALLHRLRAEGYDTGDAPLPDRDTLARLMARAGSNVPPGDHAALDRRLADGAVGIDAATYRQWYAQLPKDLCRAVEARWGPPSGDRMTTRDGRIVVPALRFGNVILAAHPAWGMDDPRALAATGALPPHHQYLAFYLWMQRDGRIDAYLPLFTQLSLMPGKQQGPAADDAVGVLIGALPHIQPLPLQANGGVGNKRRTQAVTIGFMPSFVRAGLPPDLQRIAEQLDAAPRDEAAIRRAAAAASLGRALDLDPAAAPWPALEAALRQYLAETRGAPMPRGGHVLGEVPDRQAAILLVQAMLAGNGAEAPDAGAIAAILVGEDGEADERAALVRDYAARIAAGHREMDSIVDALSGRYVPPGPNGDAIRNPDALPSGRNPYTLDIRAMPSRAAWETGSRLADELVAQHRARTGEAPRMVAFVLWSGEAVQNGGTSEAQILRLLGARPVWNARGQVVDVALDDRAALGRARIDVLVTTSGTYRDNFAGQLALIARAVRLAAGVDEPDNPVRAATEARVAELRGQGMADGEARARALRRIFSTAPGAYSPSTQFAVREGWSAQDMNRLYEARLGHAYGEGGDGDADATAFGASLARVDAAVFARSSSAYGLLDTPLPAAYLGGLSAAVRARTGRAIETYVANAQDPGAARIETLARFFGRERDSRYLNPEWVRQMQASGYNGARYMADVADSMLLWDVNMPDLVTAADWEAVRDVFLRDRHGLGLDAYFERHNPAARRKLADTMLEAVRRGAWQADGATVAELRRITAGIAPAPSSPAPGVARAVAPAGGETEPGRPAPSPDSTPNPASAPVSGFELVARPPVSPPIPAPPPWPLMIVLLGLAGTGMTTRSRW